MRTFLIWAFYINLLFCASYDFEEIKFVDAIGLETQKNGHIDISDGTVIIVYKTPTFKKIVKKDNNITIEGKDGDSYTLKGNALFYTNQFISVMSRLGEYKELDNNRDFSIQKENNEYVVTFQGDIRDIITKAIVNIKNQKVVSFKMFMQNRDTLEIIKK